MRVDVARKLLCSSDSITENLGLLAIDAALQMTNFNSPYDFHFGARKRSYGWHPKHQDDVDDWVGLFIDLFIELGRDDTDFASLVRSTLGNRFRGLWTNAFAVDKLEEAASVFHKVDGWPDGWRGVRMTMHFDKKNMPEAAWASLLELENKLSPKDLLGNVRGRIFAKSNHRLYEIDDGSAVSNYKRARKKAESLGSLVAVDDTIFRQILPELAAQNSEQIWSFGLGVGAEVEDPQIYINMFRAQLALLPENKRSIQFLVAFLCAASVKHKWEIFAFLDGVITDDILGPYFPNLQCGVELDENAVERLIKSLGLGLAPLHRYQSLSCGRVTDSLSADQIARIINALRVHPNSQIVAFDILGMVISGADRKNESYHEKLREFCSTFLNSVDWAQVVGPSDHFVKDVIEYSISYADGVRSALEILRRILDSCETDQFLFRERSKFLLPLFKRYADHMLDELFVSKDKFDYKKSIKIMTAEWEGSPAFVDVAPTETIIEWCADDPVSRIPIIANCCDAFEPFDSAPTSWSELAIFLLRNADDKAPILDAFIKRSPSISQNESSSTVMRQRAALLEQLPTLVDDISLADIQLGKSYLDERAERMEGLRQIDDRRNFERFE